MRDTIRRFAGNEEGATLLEYGMLVMLIALLCIAALTSIGPKISAGFTNANAQLP